MVAGGSCIYQGSVKSLVPYFKSLNLNCPSYYNPADFGKFKVLFNFDDGVSSFFCSLPLIINNVAMEVACGEYGNVHDSLVDAIENGRIIYSESSSLAVTPIYGKVLIY